ncbi:MAG: hypothetical protein ACRELG_11300, partial [Gemmataceae bacterium]
LTSEVVGMVALGIGLGSPLVGFLSGGKVELGMVPIGAVGMIVATLIAACTLDRLPALIVCITLIGFFTGFYIVPLFTLLQHRAPKTSKGDAIATSNFINVTGAIVSSVLFFLLVGAAHLSGITPTVEPSGEIEGELVEDPKYEEGKPVRVVLRTDGGKRAVIKAQAKNGRSRAIDVEPELIDVFGRGLKAGDRVIDRRFRLESVTYHRVRRADQAPKPFYDESGLPRLLFLGAASLTLFTLLLLWRQMPDLFLRTLIWLRTQRRYRLEIEGLSHLPDNGPVLAVTNARGTEACRHVISAVDRTIRFSFAKSGDATEESMARRTLERTLARGGVAGLSLEDGGMAERLLGELAVKQPVPVLPVWYEPAPAPENNRRRRIYILGGRLLPAGTSAWDVQAELQRVAEAFQQQMARGEVLKHIEFRGH